jgi:hypothetical protein
MILNFTKVVNDCQAILLLAQNGFYVQAGIVARSTMDACYLMMHIGSEGDDAAIAKRWLAGDRVTHWMLLDRLNYRLSQDDQPTLDSDSYRQVRRRLDAFVHASYEGLKLYLAQLSGPASTDEDSLRELTIWKNLMHLYLVVCLLVVRLTVPGLEEQAVPYLDQLLDTETGLRTVEAAVSARPGGKG